MTRAHGIASVLALLAIVWSDAALAADERTEQVAMRDGVRLATDLYLPEGGAGPWPAVLIRTPYDKSGQAEVGRNAARAGVAVVAQDMRGRFASEGVACVFRCDGEDGADTIAWIRAQPWSNGTVLSFGGSALGIAQYMHAAEAPPGLAAMWVEVATPTVYDHGIAPGGAFRQAMMEGWLTNQESLFFLDEIIAHPLRDAFWDPVQTADRFGEVQVPAIHVGGWYDIFSQGTLDAFMGYQHRGGAGARGRQKLVMGPWVHGGRRLGRLQGELRYPERAVSGGPFAPDVGLLDLWLRHYSGLDPQPSAMAEVPAVQYFVMGDVDDPGAPGNVWRATDDWPPPAAPVRMHLWPDGALAEACPPADGRFTEYTYDPADPSPTVGGANLLLRPGPYDQRAVEARDDVVVFETPPLASALEITGRVRAHLFASTDTPDTDVVVRMTDVYPDGRSMLVLDAAQRLATRADPARIEPVTPGEVVEVTVDLWSTSIIVARGHRLRISIASSNAPRFWPNPNDGSSFGAGGEPRVAKVRIHHDAARPSYLEVPSPQRTASSVTRCAPEKGGEVAGSEPSEGCRCTRRGEGTVMLSMLALGWAWSLCCRVRRRRRGP